MTKPTREHVQAMKQTLAREGVEFLYPFEVRELLDAYLALLNEEDRLRSGFQRTIDDLSRTIDLLQAEHQALKAKLEGSFKFDEPKHGEPLPYPINEEDQP